MSIYGLFRAPVLGNTLYHAIVSRWGLRYFLRGMTYHDADLVTGELVDDYYRTSHQPGARYFRRRLRLGQAQPRGRRPLAAGAAPDPDLLGPRSEDDPRRRRRSASWRTTPAPSRASSRTRPSCPTTSGPRPSTKRSKAFLLKGLAVAFRRGQHVQQVALSATCVLG